MTCGLRIFVDQTACWEEYCGEMSRSFVASSTNYGLIGHRWELVHWSGSQHVIVQHTACGFRLCLKELLLTSNFWNRCIHGYKIYIFLIQVSASSQTQCGSNKWSICSRLLMSVSGEERTTVRCCSTRHTWESDSAFVAEREFCDVLWLCVTLCNNHWRLCTQKIFTPMNYC